MSQGLALVLEAEALWVTVYLHTPLRPWILSHRKLSQHRNLRPTGIGWVHSAAHSRWPSESPTLFPRVPCFPGYPWMALLWSLESRKNLDEAFFVLTCEIFLGVLKQHLLEPRPVSSSPLNIQELAVECVRKSLLSWICDLSASGHWHNFIYPKRKWICFFPVVIYGDWRHIFLSWEFWTEFSQMFDFFY